MVDIYNNKKFLKISLYNIKIWRFDNYKDGYTLFSHGDIIDAPSAMKYYILIIGLIFIFINGNAQKKKKQKSGEINLVTYSFLRPKAEDLIRAGVERPENVETVEQAIDEQMQMRGFEFTESENPDILISYFAKAVAKQNATTVGVSMGGASYSGRSAVGYSVGTSKTTIHAYREGTLIVDLVDNKKMEVFWSGSAKEKIQPADGLEKIYSIVEKVFRKFKFQAKTDL